jgi:hypothetical protein
MSLLICNDCHNKVSTSAMTCVHCGNVLKIGKPGVIGSALRILYGLFCLVLVLIVGGAAVSAYNSLIPGDAVFVVAIGAGIWLAGSISIVVLLYVTRNEKIVAVQAATSPMSDDQHASRSSGWANMSATKN